MKRYVLLVLLVTACWLYASSDWQPLFNGEDLSGWKANVVPESFSVKEGLLVAHCPHPTLRSHLFYVGSDTVPDKFKNFELKVIARAEPNSNSGIFFHTDYSVRDEKMHLAKGYEVQLNSAEKEKRKTGSLYAIVDLAESPVDDSKWFEMHLIVNGKRIQVSLDGKQVIDYTEPENPGRPPDRKGRLLDPEGGAIAIQAHDPGSTWYFKEIKIKRLPD